MSNRIVFWGRLSPTLFGAALFFVLGTTAWSWQPPPANRNAGVNVVDLTRGPIPLPPTPPQGAWGEVIMASPRWMVVQNHLGQQFPISSDAISQFLIRWPASLNDLTPNSIIEAIGPDQGSNTLRTDHIDVFEGTDTSLVNPTFTSLLPNNRVVTTVDPGFNRFMNAFDIGSQNMLYGWAFPVPPGQTGIPQRLHVVGNAFGVNPLRVGVLGNNFANILPGDGESFSITQVTRGNPSFAAKGDLIFLMPIELTPKTAVLSQVVLYKQMPYRNFRPR
ncbi:MAG: hypothetical protein NVSMB9_34410 [Isosphaeraceae bacterium]